MKRDLIEYTKDNFGLYKSLEIHLTSNFYPPLPSQVKLIFLDAFQQYWAGLIDADNLVKELSRVYRGSLYDYGFDNYLIHEDEDF